jgi:PTS system cellobiose-specific IIB component
MYKVLIVCQGGMSSSFVVNKIKAAFRDHNEEIEMHAYAAMELVDYIDEVETVLVAPNVTYMMDNIEATCKAHGMEPIVIPLDYYGQMDGEAIRKLIIDSKK